jgi:hypothetical protein
MNQTKKTKHQIDRFRETARELEADESGEAFERAFGKIVPPKKPRLRKDKSSGQDNNQK